MNEEKNEELVKCCEYLCQRETRPLWKLDYGQGAVIYYCRGCYAKMQMRRKEYV